MGGWWHYVGELFTQTISHLLPVLPKRMGECVCVYDREEVFLCGGVWRWCSGVWRWCSGVWRCVVVCGGDVVVCGGGVVGCGGGVVGCGGV